MRRPDDYQSSRRALAAEYRGSPRTVPLSLGPSRGGHFHVCLRVVHVVDVVQRACECVYGVSTSYGCMWNRWYHQEPPTGSRARSWLSILNSRGEGVKNYDRVNRYMKNTKVF